jgi:hypothetical protein
VELAKNVALAITHHKQLGKHDTSGGGLKIVHWLAAEDPSRKEKNQAEYIP